MTGLFREVDIKEKGYRALNRQNYKMAKIKQKYVKTKFKKRIRISAKNLEWISKNKTTKTYAGMLDIIINFYKLYGNEEL